MTDAEKREKVIQSLRRCIYDPDPGQTKKEYLSCSGCAYHHGCTHDLMRDALAILKEQEEKIESLTEDIEVWKRRYKVMVLECKSSDDPNKEPAIVRYYTTEEVEQGKEVAFPND